MKISAKFLAQLALAAGMTLISTQTMAAIRVASPHRKVNADGIGNCVFSTSVLGFKQDSSYHLTTKFTAPQEVHARCYFPKMTKEYVSLGKIYNSLRDKKEKYASINVKGSHGLFEINQMKFTYGPNNADWDQQRFDITGKADSDFMLYDRDAQRFGGVVKNSQSTVGGYSLNLANYTKAMAESNGNYPYTAHYCLDVTFRIADDTKVVEKWNSDHTQREFVKEPVYKTHYISNSCFDYTINQASDVSWSDKDESQTSSSTPSTNSSDAQKAIDDKAKKLLKGLGF